MAGRYMSIAKGPMAVRRPRMRAVRKNELVMVVIFQKNGATGLASRHIALRRGLTVGSQHECARSGGKRIRLAKKAVSTNLDTRVKLDTIV
jgi:hypothetical protein